MVVIIQCTEYKRKCNKKKNHRQNTENTRLSLCYISLNFKRADLTGYALHNAFYQPME